MSGLAENTFWITLLDTYNDHERKSIEHSLYFRHSTKEPFPENPTLKAFFDVIREQNPFADLTGFIYQFSKVRPSGVIYDRNDLEDIEKGFSDFNYKYPPFLTNAIKELEKREIIIKGLLNRKESHKEDYRDELLNSINVNYNDVSKISDLEERFASVRTDIKNTVNKVYQMAGYSIEGYYREGKFIIDEFSLNDLIVNAERGADGINSLVDIWRLIREYVEANEKLEVISELIGNFSNKPVESKKPTLSVEENYLIPNMRMIYSSWDAFKEVLFELMPFNDYLTCFDLNNRNPKHPVFVDGREADFIYFLRMIEDFKFNDKYALERFGIKQFRQRAKTNRKGTFEQLVKNILKLK